jgi:hypothetical protein
LVRGICMQAACGGVVVWWCGGVMVWLCGCVVVVVVVVVLGGGLAGKNTACISVFMAAAAHAQ